MEELSTRDIVYLGTILATLIGFYYTLKYQGKENAKDIAMLKEYHDQELKEVKETTDKQWNKIDEGFKEVSDIKERITRAIDMETAEKKFVTKELFELHIKQLDVDLKQTKGIAQNVLDAVQTLTTSLNTHIGSHK